MRLVWSTKFARDLVFSGRESLVGSGFCNGFNGWVVGFPRNCRGNSIRAVN
jgi:hypothetical protein